MPDRDVSGAHRMDLVCGHEGTEEWHCPVCGRTLLIEWEPWRRVVAVDGDEAARHTGSKGGLVIGMEVDGRNT